VHGLELLASPIRIDGQVQTADSPAPSAGNDTTDVLTTVLGYDDARIDELVSTGAVVIAPPEGQP
jgi:crotonobetainyl-CoA:carnitine CoA-transferase CaiB-like acyl-CoA transferase